MRLSLLAPLAAALILACTVTAVHRRLRPVVAARVTLATIAVVVIAAVPTLWLISIGFIAHTPLLGRGFRWCAETFGVHRRVPTWAGLSACLFSAVGLARGARALRLHRRLRGGSSTIEVAEHATPFAYTMPGATGDIVISTGLLAILEPEEQSVVIAHERAHALHRHDRFLLACRMAELLVPLLRPLCRRLTFSLERWADEAAVAACGDRQLVARTLGKVALTRTTPASAMAFAGLGVAGRVDALLAASPQRSRPLLVTMLVVGSIAVAGFGAMQLHHLASIIVTLCPD